MVWCIIFFLFYLVTFSAPYLSEQPLDSSLLSQRSPAPATSSSSSSSSISSGLQSTNTTSTSSAQPAQTNSTPSASSLGSQTIGGMTTGKPSSYSPFGTAGLQGSATQNGPQSNLQSGGGLAENGASQSQGPTEAPERSVPAYSISTKIFFFPLPVIVVCFLQNSSITIYFLPYLTSEPTRFVTDVVLIVI